MVQLEINGKEQYLSATQVENIISELQRKLKLAKDVIRTLEGCLPNVIYVYGAYGAYGDQWSADEPPTDEFEEINLGAALAELEKE